MSSYRFGVREAALFLAALLFVLLIQGALPFLAAPTMGQAVWAMGFSQSFLNDSIFSIYAHNFGAPNPAAIAFGLAGAWPAAVLMKCGLTAIDAYSAMIGLWMTVAFVSAYKFGRYFSVSPALAILGAVAWGTMPVIWAHAGYSMLSTGIALLPFYFLTLLPLISVGGGNELPHKTADVKRIFGYFVACIIAIFMDGYSFMMFAAGGGLLGLCSFIKAEKEHRNMLLRFSFPIYLSGLGLAYALYALYVGKPQFESAPMDFFRGWGVDLTFLVVPTRGVHWVMDALGLSIPRSEDVFFGDFSVWTTSFCLPVIVGAFWAFRRLSAERRMAMGFAVVALFGFYMALGPSLKINSVKPAGQPNMQLMPKEFAIAGTGSEVLSGAVPGFKNMRASYRWLALGVFASWVLLAMVLSLQHRKYVTSGAILLGFVILLNLPHIPEKLENDIQHRDGFLALESDVINDMAQVVSPGERVAFLPWRNDFLVNYAASRLKIVTYNIGGDKNLEEAMSHWPSTMREFPMATVDTDFASRVLLLLAKKEADVVILPYIDTLWAGDEWTYPVEFKDALSPVVKNLVSSGMVEVDDREYYATVRLKPALIPLAGTTKFEEAVGRRECTPPYCLRRNGFVAPENSFVGIVRDGKLRSTGIGGFLYFGPYVAMKKGEYQLTVRGKSKTADSAWVDVVSGRGAAVHGQFKLNANSSDRDQTIVAGNIKLDSSVEDLEVRVHVEGQDRVVLQGYSLEPVKE
jgi:hypothetical protein